MTLRNISKADCEFIAIKSVPCTAKDKNFIGKERADAGQLNHVMRSVNGQYKFIRLKILTVKRREHKLVAITLILYY